MEYAQVRMQARHGAQPDEALWRQLGGHDSLAAYLAAARATGLAGWIAGIGDGADAHVIERTLRQRWRQAVAELAGWMPAEWQQAVRCTAGLIDLPARAHLARGGEMQRWMADDPGVAGEAASNAGRDSQQPPTDRRQWLEAWRQRWPAGDEDEKEALARLAASLARHLEALPLLPPAAAREARRALRQAAALSFRRLAFRPGAAFAYLLLLALDLERLRAELVLRAVAAEAAS